MRLNEKNRPVYFAIKKGDIAQIKVDPNMRMFFEQKDMMATILSTIALIDYESEKTWYCSERFFEAAMTAIKKVDGLKWEEIHPHSGHLITQWGHISYTVNADSDLPLAIVIFSKEQLMGNLLINKELEFRGYFRIKNERGELVYDPVYSANMVYLVFGLLWFIDNCDCEEYICKPNEKNRSIKEKIINESKSDLIVYDCSWFTTIIRDTPFSVTGHWRLQPYGEKRGKRRLKWIESFEKKGYVRRAKAEKENQNT